MGIGGVAGGRDRRSGNASILAISLGLEAGARHVKPERALECVALRCVAAVPADIG
jgi:hypothetical protein